jgi:hypothetical protein
VLEGGERGRGNPSYGEGVGRCLPRLVLGAAEDSGESPLGIREKGRECGKCTSVHPFDNHPFSEFY